MLFVIVSTARMTQMWQFLMFHNLFEKILFHLSVWLPLTSVDGVLLMVKLLKDKAATGSRLQFFHIRVISERSW